MWNLNLLFFKIKKRKKETHFNPTAKKIRFIIPKQLDARFNTEYILSSAALSKNSRDEITPTTPVTKIQTPAHIPPHSR